MQDKEVGELRRACRSLEYRGIISSTACTYITQLIRKLVEERAVAYNKDNKLGPIHNQVLALRDFNIPPETWK